MRRCGEGGGGDKGRWAGDLRCPGYASRVVWS